jgi:hypothetical protein
VSLVTGRVTYPTNIGRRDQGNEGFPKTRVILGSGSVLTQEMPFGISEHGILI